LLLTTSRRRILSHNTTLVKTGWELVHQVHKAIICKVCSLPNTSLHFACLLGSNMSHLMQKDIINTCKGFEN
jgi:hypothetical protein